MQMSHYLIKYALICINYLYKKSKHWIRSFSKFLLTYSWSQKFTYTSPNLQKVDYFTKWIIQSACYGLTSSDLDVYM